jgi:hypothetical protein
MTERRNAISQELEASRRSHRSKDSLVGADQPALIQVAKCRLDQIQIDSWQHGTEHVREPAGDPAFVDAATG